jgi:death on curing protein
VKKAPVWLLRETVLAMHDLLIAEFGGAAGIRDEGLLDSALSRPQNLFAHTPSSSLFDLAASFAFGLIKNHPFLDGNKRVAFTAAATFLHLNGRRIEATEVEATVRTLALAAGAMTEAQYAAWLKTNARTSRDRK